MGKFKVGDRVVGNEKANRYGITVEGWEGTVIRVGNGYISVNGPGSCGGDGFSVDPDCFDMLQPAPNSHLDEHISIFARKNRVVATITKGDQKFTQSVSLHKANGDFKTAVKMVVEKLLDRFEIREQVPLTASTIDWEAFKRGEFAVHCDTEEKAEAFLKECDEQGIRWADGTSLLVNSKWTEYKTETLYGFDGEYGLCYGTSWGFNNMPTIDYTPSKPAVKEVKRPAKVGEWIRVTDAGGHDNGTGVFMVTRLAKCSNGWVYVNWRDIGVIRDDQYVVLENYQPEDKPLDSKSETIEIGDTVKVIDTEKGYTTYPDWFDKFAPKYASRYAYSQSVENGFEGKVVAKHEHEFDGAMLYAIQQGNYKVYLIGEKGIEKVRS